MRPVCVFVFLYLVHLLYHEVGLKSECCWSFLVTLTVCGVTFYLGKQQAQVSSLCQRSCFPKQRLTLRDPIRQSGNLIFFLFGQQWFLFFCLFVCYLFQQQEIASACGAILGKLFESFMKLCRSS